MGYLVEIDEGGLLPGFAVLHPKKGLKYKGRYYAVLSVSIVSQDNSKSFLGSAGSAALGGVALGAVGLLAGALAGGNKNKTMVMLECENNVRLIGTIPSRSVPAVLNIVERLKNLTKDEAPHGSNLFTYLIWTVLIFTLLFLLLAVA